MSLTGAMTTQTRKTPHIAVHLRRTGRTTGTGRLIMVGLYTASPLGQLAANYSVHADDYQLEDDYQ